MLLELENNEMELKASLKMEAHCCLPLYNGAEGDHFKIQAAADTEGKWCFKDVGHPSHHQLI